MNLAMALHQVCGRTDLFLVRPEGEVLMVTRNLSVKNVSSGKPQPWKATFGALVADNWEVMTLQKLQQMMAERAGQGG
jgi:hypothetical protein